MKSRKHTASLRLPIMILMMAVALVTATDCLALPNTHYREHSRLAEGNWRTVKVAQAGMHFIGNATLRSMGFMDPAKVRVYGTGGAMEPEALSEAMADDLPLIPSCRTEKGIVFYATDNFTWKQSSGSTPYTHEIHPYSQESIYFLSDSGEEGETIPRVSMAAGNGERVTSFTDRLVHEQELEHLGESGRTYLGEDFRSTKSRDFKITLPGNAGESATMALQFASRTSNGNAKIALTVNGESLAEQPGDNLPAIATGESYGTVTKSVREVPTDGEQFDLNIAYTYSGVLFLARLDYIELFYTRRMALNGGELLIHGSFPGQTLEVSGCSQSAQVWDVTNKAYPKLVDFTLEGDKALIGVADGNYHELIVFNPEEVTRSVTTGSSVANQDLHALEAPDMLIITPPEYADGARLIADLHESTDKMNVHIIAPQLIYNEFSGGKQDVTAFRKLLKMWNDRNEGKTRYCLIMGKPSFDNKRINAEIKNAGYKPMPIWQSPDGLTEASSYSSDDYIGMLDDSEPGKFFMRSAKIHVAVGRLPVTDATESRQTAQKIVDHVLNPDLGAWRNKIQLIADDGNANAHLDQSQNNYANLRSAGNGDSYLYDRVYLDSYTLTNTATGPTYPQATAKMLSNYNEGVAYTNYVGHASEVSWGHEQLWTWDQIINMANPNLTFIYAATCRFMPWDEPGMSAGESLMLNTKGGVCGMIAASRTVYISQNNTLNGYVCSEMFKPGDDGRARPLGDIYVAGKNRYPNDDNKLRYAFMGDPAMRLNNINMRVTVDSIGGTPVSPNLDATAFPVLPGGSRVRISGRVLNADGSPASRFNGKVTIQLYDAETVVQTHGNNDGEETVYNDRKTRLAIANANVRNGHWTLSMTVPMEISNNYAPALLSAYAWNEKGSEANGASEQLYVYGFDDSQAADTDGPAIEYFRLNREGFKPGDVVNPNPVVFARLSDPSGINLSDAGVGHKISLRLDDKTPYDDVSQYFTPDMEGTGGSLMYPLKDIAPGRHTLTLEAWDNLNNSTRQTIDFGVSANADPYIVSLGTDCNPATSGVTFIISLDQPNTVLACDLKVYDLSGRTVWEFIGDESSGTTASVNARWNLCDKGGTRVPRGIYVYKARVQTPQGTWSSKAGKLAVTAQ